LVDLLVKTLRDRGIDVDEILRTSRRNSVERGRRLAERLAHSVLPLFIQDNRGRPDRIGSCVLVRVGSRPYAFTAGHVLKAAGSSRLFASPGPKGKLLPLPYTAAPCAAGEPGGLECDVGVLPLHDNALGAFAHCAFLTGNEIDENDEPDGNGILDFYFVFGYPASRTQVNVSHALRQIHQRSFQLTTSPQSADAYLRESLPQRDYLLLDFLPKRTYVAGRLVAPPRLKGASGGGVFHISRSALAGPLVAIATEHRRKSCCIVSTRIKHFLAAARQLNGNGR